MLLNHLKSHSIYKCNKCEYKTVTPQAFTEHSKTHGKQKRFMCSECEYVAVTLNKLNTHMRTHTENEITVENLIEVAKSPTPEKTSSVKRGLSVSPEVADINKKALRSNNHMKKIKN